MAKFIYTTAAMLLLTGGPALSIAPHCKDQLNQLSEQIQQATTNKQVLQSKYDEAQRLCDQNQDEQAQNLAQQIRKMLAGDAPQSNGRESSGSSSPNR